MKNFMAAVQYIATNKNDNLLKLNIFNTLEIDAFMKANQDLGGTFKPVCFMLGDSILNTHYQQKGTSLREQEAINLFLSTMKTKIMELALHLKSLEESFSHPVFLLADMPFGTTDTPEQALINCQSMLDYGADAVKLELYDDARFEICNRLAQAGLPVIAHIGYTPQKEGKKLCGETIEDALEILSQAYKAYKNGAAALVVEGLTTATLELLAASIPPTLPLFCIFSGRAPNAIQSINIWDSLYRPPFETRFFPESAQYETSTHPCNYRALPRACRDILLNPSFSQGH